MTMPPRLDRSVGITERCRSFVLRFNNSAVVWSWGLNFLRLGTGLLLLPLLLRLPTEDLGLYWVLLGLQAIVPLLDLGFLPSIDRAVGYAMGGAKNLKQQGPPDGASSDASPNYALLWRLLHVTRALYRWLSLLLLFGLGAWGTYTVELGVQETSAPARAWAAWGITLMACALEMYAGWWSIYLRALNKVLLYSQIVVAAYAIKFLLSCALLLADTGLLAVPIASLVSSLISRAFARKQCLKFLSAHPHPPPSGVEVRATVWTLWPNSWRTALHYLSSYLTSNANAFICLLFLGLAVNAAYGLSLQIVVICQGMASVWTHVKWPLFSQLRARQDLATLRRTFRNRLWLASVTYATLAGLVLLLHEPLLHALRSGKTVLPFPWFPLLLLNGWFEMHYILWGTLVATENRAPFVVPSIITSVTSLLLTVGLVHHANLGAGALVVGPFVAGCAFNYWYWPREGARGIKTSWTRIMFTSGK
jgi:O-antigen/teichoic acid export membrane protein